MSDIVYMVEGVRMSARYSRAVWCGVKERVKMSAIYCIKFGFWTKSGGRMPTRYSRAVWCLGEEGLRMPARFCIQVGYGIEEGERVPARYSINMCMGF